LVGEVERLGGGGDGDRDGGMDDGSADGEGRGQGARSGRQLREGWADEIPVMRKWMRVLEERGVRAGVDLRYEREGQHAVA